MPDLSDRSQVPTRTSEMEDHQVWVWMNNPSQWEIRGTGAVISPELEKAYHERRAKLIEND